MTSIDLTNHSANRMITYRREYTYMYVTHECTYRSRCAQWSLTNNDIVESTHVHDYHKRRELQNKQQHTGHTHTHTHIYIYIYTHVHTYVHTYIHIYIYICMHIIVYVESHTIFQSRNQSYHDNQLIIDNQRPSCVSVHVRQQTKTRYNITHAIINRYDDDVQVILRVRGSLKPMHIIHDITSRYPQCQL